MFDAKAVLATTMLLASGGALAQISANGGEFQVNSYTTGTQAGAAVTATAGGNFVVVWESSLVPGSVGSLRAQRFDAGGSPLGPELQVSSSTTGSLSFPSVASDASGRFVVVWQLLADRWGVGFEVKARQFDADGVPAGGEFLVNTLPVGYNELYGPGAARVAASAAGNFVVIWSSLTSSGNDTSGWSVQARRYDAYGTPLGEQFQVNTYTTSDQLSSALAADAAGNFVVAWETQVVFPGFYEIQARRYDSDGAPMGDEFAVNTYTTGEQWSADLAFDGQGNFVVAWASNGSYGTDEGWSVQARRYDANGVPMGGQFQVNSYTTSAQWSPAVAADAAGGFVVAWTSWGSSGPDSDGWSMQAQRYSPGGLALGSEFQVNSYTTGAQWAHAGAVAADAPGNFIVTWSSEGSSGSDTSGSSIQAQRYDALFRDGFETGDTSRWSGAIP